MWYNDSTRHASLKPKFEFLPMKTPSVLHYKFVTAQSLLGLVKLHDISEVDPDDPNTIMAPFPRCSVTKAVSVDEVEIPDSMRLLDGTTVQPRIKIAGTLEALQQVNGEEGLVIASRWPSCKRIYWLQMILLHSGLIQTTRRSTWSSSVGGSGQRGFLPAA